MKTRTKTYYYLDERERAELKRFIERSGKSLNDLAQKLGVSKGHLSNVLAGKKALTDDLQKRFANLGIEIIF